MRPRYGPRVLALRQRVDEDGALRRQVLDVFAGESGGH